MSDKFCSTCDMYPANCHCPKPSAPTIIVGDVEATFENPDASKPPKDAGARKWTLEADDRGIAVKSGDMFINESVRVIEYAALVKFRAEWSADIGQREAAYEKLERELKIQDDANEILTQDLAEAKAEVEKTRMQLCACGVAALQNTKEASDERITKDNQYWSAAYGDVCDAVDREMKERAESAALVSALEEAARVSVAFSQFSLKQRLIVAWFIFMGRTIDFNPVKSKPDMEIAL